MSIGPPRPSPATTLETGPEAAAAPQRIAARYDIVDELGRGGMALVYRVVDSTDGRSLALKQLLAQDNDKRAREATTLFEREYHTLAQLSHPRVIEVYDYGVDDRGPFYTMELLDGGDLREQSPLPWQQACELLYDVCSSLALLHSRRFVHRDISPRNVRCTRDGHAKLIDFGAMVPMGSGSQLVGTPPFVAPEVVHGSMLDARTDLFSLGATLYFALTGRLAYPARDFTQLVEAWSHKPPAPSLITLDVPPALDALVSSMLSLEPALRPRSAFEVMQRLAAVANIVRSEPLSVSSGYLATPLLVGRDDALQKFRQCAARALRGQGRQGLLVVGEAGVGRSRMLDACVLEAKLLGASVLRATALAGANAELAVAKALADQLLATLPETAIKVAHECNVFATLFDAELPANEQTSARAPQLKSFARSGAERLTLQRALADWLLRVSDVKPLLIAVDDVQDIDDPSVALLAVLADRGRRHRLLMTATLEQHDSEVSNTALELLAGKCQSLSLRALASAETELVLGSVFGDVPNLSLLSTRVHAIAAGNPRQSMALAQHLVDRELILYDAGHWTLPEKLAANDLPASAEEAFLARVAALQPLARRLAEAQALADFDAFTRDDYAWLEPEANPRSLDAAITELVSQRIVLGDGHSYLLAARKQAIREALPKPTQRERHRALAELQQRSGRPILGRVRHLLLSGQEAPALDCLTEVLPRIRDRSELVAASRMDVSVLAETLKLAWQEARRLGRSAREVFEMQRWLTATSVVSDDALYFQSAPSWLAQLERDSGLSDWRELHEVSDKGQRLTQALQRAAQRYAAAPSSERVYPPDEAIRLLVHFVVISIAIGARTLEARVLLSLPELLEPFAALSPMLHAIWQNSLATRESTCYRQPEHSSARWAQVYERLAEVRGNDAEFVDSIRNAVAFGIGLAEATMSLDAALRWAEVLDRDPLQQVNAMTLRKITRLQRGDFDGAERFRKQAELLAVQSSLRQMFTNMLPLELGVHAAAWDLTGVKQLAARIEPLAERYRGWLPFRHLAQAHFQRLRGDLEAACREYERCLELSAPDAQDPQRSIAAWPTASAAYVETLIALGRAAEARSHAEHALLVSGERGLLSSAHDLRRSLALAEAKLGEHAAGAARLDTLIEEQTRLGVVGLNLGASYEARARIAIWATDKKAIEHFAALAAAQYRHGHGSPLGARYERLMDEARGAGITVLPQLSAFEHTVFGTTDFGTRLPTAAVVAVAMSGAAGREARAQRALQLLCEARGACGGSLYLAAPEGLKLMAATSDVVPDAAMQTFVDEFWAQQLADDDPDTEIPMDDTSESTYGTVIWSDEQGAIHQPLLISCTIDGVPNHAGVALLVPTHVRARAHAGMRVVSELALLLLRAGDTTGVRANS